MDACCLLRPSTAYGLAVSVLSEAGLGPYRDTPQAKLFPIGQTLSEVNAAASWVVGEFGS